MSKPSGLTPVQERILCEAIYPFHFLTLEQITRLLYSSGSKNGVGHLLLKLTEAGYVDRFKLPTGFPLQPYVYMLGRRGKKYFEEEKGWEVPKLPTLAVMQARSHSFLTHLLELNTVIIQAKLLEKETPPIRLLHFEHDTELKKQPIRTTSHAGRHISIVPDAILDIEGAQRRVLWVELERGTNKDSDILAKMQDIYDVFDIRAFQERVGTNRCRVCYVTTAGNADRERLQRVARKVLLERLGEAAANSKRNLIFNFLAIPPMGTKGGNGKEGEIDGVNMFVNPVWATPFGDTLYRIIEE